MQDIRIERWAHTLVHYSLNVKPGETVAILATPLAAPLVEAVYREVLRVGAHPLPLIELENLDEVYYERAMMHNSLQRLLFSVLWRSVLMRSFLSPREATPGH